MQNHKVAVRTHASAVLNFCHFSRELLGCDLWLLGKVVPSWRAKYNARKIILFNSEIWDWSILGDRFFPSNRRCRIHSSTFLSICYIASITEWLRHWTFSKLPLAIGYTTIGSQTSFLFEEGCPGISRPDERVLSVNEGRIVNGITEES